MAAIQENESTSSDDEDYLPPIGGDEAEDNDDLEYDDVDDDLIQMNHKPTKSDKKDEKIANNSETEKKRIDALWEDFLADTNTTSSNTQLSTNKKENTQKSYSNENSVEFLEKKNVTADIFDGNNDESHTKPSVSCSKVTQGMTSKLPETVKRRWEPNIKCNGGLINAAKLLSKKKKMSVLDKSDVDWKEFVEKEGIAEDLKSHGRSKESYLDKQDFLLKADFSKFQEEKALRQLERTKQNKY